MILLPLESFKFFQIKFKQKFIEILHLLENVDLLRIQKFLLGSFPCLKFRHCSIKDFFLFK